MSDRSELLKIPDDKRAGTSRVRLFDKPERSRLPWVLVPLVVVLNGWFDYYHPRGFLFDIIYVIALVVAWGRQK